MTNKINTFDALGRFLIDQTYNILLDAEHYEIDYEELKRLLQRRIDRNPNIDKKFAMHKYNHGKSTWHVSTYRWENVLYYYINQHQKVFFLHRVYNPHPNVNIHRINLMNSLLCLDNWHHDLDMAYMFDAARETNKKEEEQLINKEAEDSLNKRAILHKIWTEKQRWEKYNK